MFNSILNFPKIITSEYLKDTLADIWRDKATLSDKMNGLYYRSVSGNGEFYNKNTGKVVVRYEFQAKMTGKPKYKLVLIH